MLLSQGFDIFQYGWFQGLGTTGQLIVSLLVFGVSLAALLRSADYFVETAEIVGVNFKVPAFIIGATLVAFGTSLPELATAVSSLLNDTSTVIAGTVTGSNTANILFITGVGLLLIEKLEIDIRKNAVEFGILFGVSVLLLVFLSDRTVTLTEGIVCVVLLVAYIVYILKFSRSRLDIDEDEAASTPIDAKRWTLFVLSGAGIYLGAELTVEAIQEISVLLKLEESSISATAVAIGTSLPELAVTIAAARKGLSKILLGNVIGSNIFNSLCVIGIPAILAGILPKDFLVDDSVLQFTGVMMMLATVLFLLLAFWKKTPRYFGVFFLLLYMFFIAGEIAGLDLLGLFGVSIA